MSALLVVEDVVKRFGGVAAVDGVSFTLDAGQVLGLIGPNGSGKTTLLGVLAGTHDPTSGKVTLDGRTASGRGAHRAVSAGIARTFQTTRLFGTWTLREALRLAHGERRGRPGWPDEQIANLLGLGDALDRPGASLTSAAQRLAMIALALATGPRVLLLDEPAVGMDGTEAAALAAAVRRAAGELGVAVVVVDHNMQFLMPLADTVLVMAAGAVLASGTPAQIRSDEAVIASYLGEA
ncbi:Branched-chain amino acid transport ATP-binding protein LivG [Actinokineospora spheciospongiae]|uniref:Branched-chain amino acid transport ATP-binding protein LivG n=1 Tax=Actinokineospora spheciospongiae TaxID=909613 RepID=W7IPH7_9PSEU|nr:ATP-binding cassette domain-containing protein [Actinokineospora spheciospongiae]EWC62303.1 Branched-chain amino acid transport ATP-binding protein LivG [Actinokineospora spheciospongiae]